MVRISRVEKPVQQPKYAHDSNHYHRIICHIESNQPISTRLNIVDNQQSNLLIFEVVTGLIAGKR